MRGWFVGLVCGALGVALVGAARADGPELGWQTVVNNGDEIPGSNPSKTFNSYGQPSVNAAGLVVFRGRKGPQEPVRGVYARDMGAINAPIDVIASVGTAVPQPNNTLYNGEPASFNEFPSFPRIDAGSPTVATRGQSQPVWTYLLPDTTESRVGTAGIFANPGGALTTGVALLGAVADATTSELVFPQFQVPGAPPGTRFDQFPGAPAVTDGSIVAFKGNYQDVVSQTGVFYRDLLAEAGAAPVELIARSGDPIPEFAGAVFGSTAPPSAANGHMVFVGSDNEDAPTAGGVYRAALAPSAPLETLVAIGDPVPNEPGALFTKFGEGLSISSAGRHVGFWGAWGSETTPLTLICPTEGNQDLIAYCNEQYPNGFEVLVPVHQGIFVYDTVLGSAVQIASTGQDGIEDFVYWGFSGRPPGVGGGGEGETEDQEPPRWRSASFVAVSGDALAAYGVAFKARRNGVDGIYIRHGGVSPLGPLATALEVGQSGAPLDPEAPEGSLVAAVGLERDGFRQGRLALNASMLAEGETEEESEGWAGIYLTSVPEPDADGDGVPDATDDCRYEPNADQADQGGIGLGSEPDGIGDACQCGDVDGNGVVTVSDASLYLHSLLTPPIATLVRPDLCNVGGSAACTIADAVIVRRALLTPPIATIKQVCAASLPH